MVNNDNIAEKYRAFRMLQHPMPRLQHISFSSRQNVRTQSPRQIVQLIPLSTSMKCTVNSFEMFGQTVSTVAMPGISPSIIFMMACVCSCVCVCSEHLL